jgi:hypothetical protein
VRLSGRGGQIPIGFLFTVHRRRMETQPRSRFARDRVCDYDAVAVMFGLVVAVVGATRAALRSRANLVAENLALRQQLSRTSASSGIGVGTARRARDGGGTPHHCWCRARSVLDEDKHHAAAPQPDSVRAVY